MPSRRLLVLFLAAALAVGAYVLYELPKHRAEDRSRAEASRLFDLDPQRVERVEIDRPDANLRFALTGAHWSMLAPLRDDAEHGAVVPVITTIANADILRHLGPADEPARFGFDPPRATVRLLAARDTLAVLEIGSPTVDRAAVYARRSGGDVILVPTAVQRALLLGVDDYRSRRVVTFDIGVVRSFLIESRLTGRSAWYRAGHDAWFTVVAGDTVPGDSVAVPSVLRRLRGMRVRAFVPDADTTAQAMVSVTIHKDDGSAQTVRFFPAAPQGYHARVGGNPRTVEIADDPSDLAAESVATLRDRRVLQFDPVAARRITVTTPDTTATIVRAGDAWALPNPALGEIDAARAADLVRALRALRFQRVWPEAPLDPDSSPRFSLVIAGAGDTILEELNCTPAPGGASWVARSRSLGGTCEIDGAALDAIARRLSRLRR